MTGEIASMLCDPHLPAAGKHDAAWLSELISMFIQAPSLLPMLLATASSCA